MKVSLETFLSLSKTLNSRKILSVFYAHQKSVNITISKCLQVYKPAIYGGIDIRLLNIKWLKIINTLSLILSQ